MEPTLADEDNLIVDKITYLFRDPKRTEIVVFPYRDREGVYYIKRVIGLPGETVYIDENGYVYIDGKVLKEDYIKELANDAGIASVPVVLGEDEYFVMGDNRNNSSDSRDPSVGNIQRDQIIGKAFLRIWPLNKIGILKHQ
jgi:signal peptidase I